MSHEGHIRESAGDGRGVSGDGSGDDWRGVSGDDGRGVSGDGDGGRCGRREEGRGGTGPTTLATAAGHVSPPGRGDTGCGCVGSG